MFVVIILNKEITKLKRSHMVLWDVCGSFFLSPFVTNYHHRHRRHRETPSHTSHHNHPLSPPSVTTNDHHYHHHHRPSPSVTTTITSQHRPPSVTTGIPTAISCFQTPSLTTSMTITTCRGKICRRLCVINFGSNFNVQSWLCILTPY